MDTDGFIKLLVEDDVERLNELNLSDEWEKDIDYVKVYENIKDIDNIRVHSQLCRMYNKGLGVEVDPERALYHLGFIDRDDGTDPYTRYVTGIHYFRHALNDLYAWGQYSSGSMLMNRNYEKALRCFQLSAEHGCSDAQNTLGYFYQNGAFEKQDHQKAFYYYQLSAEQSDSRGQCGLGKAYCHGHGTEQDYEEAFYYFQLSAKQHNKSSKKLIKDLIEEWDGYLDYILKTDEEENREIIELREENRRLEEENTDLRYKPDGIGYLEAKRHFTLSSKGSAIKEYL